MQHFKDQFDGILQDLCNGKVLLMPTDTIWGLVCDATNQSAIERIYQIKSLQLGSGLVTLVRDLDMLKQYVPHLHPRIETLLTFHRRPLTVIYEDTRGLHPMLHAHDGSQAIRVTLDPICADIIQALDRPIVAASACNMTSPYPAHFGEIKSDILTQVDFIMKYRQDDRRPFMASVIARMGADEELEFIRE